MGRFRSKSNHSAYTRSYSWSTDGCNADIVAHQVDHGFGVPVKCPLTARFFGHDDHVPFLVAGLHITVGFSDLVQRIASIDYCP